MAQRLLSLDIHDEYVCGLMLAVGGKAAVVERCGLTVRSAEHPLTESVGEVLNHLGYANEPCRVALSAEHFFYRNLTFPFHDKRKIDKILAIELEDTAIVDMEHLVVDSLVTWKKGSGSAVVAAMIDRELLRQRLAELAQLELDPEIVAISNVQTALQLSRQQERQRFVVLDAGCRRAAMYVMADGRMRLIRPFVFENGGGANYAIDRPSQQVFTRTPEKAAATFAALAREVRHTLYALDDIDADAPLFLTGALADVPQARRLLADELGCEVLSCDLARPPVTLGAECGAWRGDLMTAALSLGIRAGRRQAGFNFRREEFASKASLTRYRKYVPRVGIPLLLGLLVTVGVLWHDYSSKEEQLRLLKAQAAEIFSQTLPEVRRIVDPVQQLQVEIREMQKGTLGDARLQSNLRVLDLLAEISMRIPQSVNVHIVRMVADGNSILLRGLTDNFNSVDSLKRLLEGSDYFSSVTINSANVANQETGIRFDLRLEIKGG